MAYSLGWGEPGWTEYLSLDEDLAWRKGMVINEVLLKRIDSGWRAVLKATHNSLPFVSFVYARKFDQLVLSVGHASTNPRHRWVPDKPPPWQRRR